MGRAGRNGPGDEAAGGRGEGAGTDNDGGSPEDEDDRERRTEDRPPLLTVSEVAGELRVSNMTVYRLIKRGELPAVRIGKSYRIRRSDLDAYIEAGVVQSEQG